MRPSPVPPILMACRTRCLSSPPSSSRFGPVTPCASTAASVWQLLQVWMKSYLPSSIVPEISSERRLPVPPTDSPRDAITTAGTATPSPT